MMLRAVCFLFLCCFVLSSALADPPGRVAQLSSLQGAVTLIHPSTGEAQLASLNWPITGDNELVTDNFSRTEIRIGSTAIRLGSNTDLTIQRLDDDRIQLRLNRGSLQLHVRNASRANELTLDIAQGRLAFAEPANLRVDTRDDNDVSAINVISGASYFDDGINRFTIVAGRRAEIDRGGLRVVESRNNFRDDSFDTWITERDRQDDLSGTSRYVSSDITGYQVLNSYGIWRSITTYGTIWSPTAVPAGWAPYRDGRWTWIAPWGWTWVDNAPWGYAPSHYGRWVFYEQRWCWTPGVISARPIWAPALVGWVGGDGSNYGNYRDGPSVGWFPLAPREVYVPAYQATPRYLQQINNGYSNDRATLQRSAGLADPRAATYQNQFVRNATTVMPSYQFGTSKTVVVTPSSNRSEQAQLIRNAGTSPIATTAPAAPAAPASITSIAPRAVRVSPAPSNVPWQPLSTPAMRSERGNASIAVQPAARVFSSGIVTTPRQTLYPATSAVVVRPAQSAPLNQFPAVPLTASVPLASTTAPGVANVPPVQKKTDASTIPVEQQHRARFGGNTPLDTAGAREGFGRGSLQR